MHKIVESYLAGVRKIVEDKHYSEALTRLDELESDKDILVNELDASEVHYLKAKCFFFLGDFDASSQTLESGINLSRNTLDHLLYAKQKHLKGTICWATGRTDEAVEAFLESFASRKRAGEYPALWSSFNNIGMIHLEKANLRQASEQFDNALNYALQHNTEEEVATCRRNLGLAALLRGEFRNVREQLRLLNASIGTEVSRVRVKELEAKLNVWLLDINQARIVLRQALQFYQSVGMKREQVVCLEYLGLSEYFLGNYAKAKEYYQQVLDMPEPTASAVAQTLRMLTDVQIAEGDFGKAKETAAKAEEAINKISERIELGALYRCYGQIYEHDGVRDCAHDFFVKSIDLLRELGAKYELALSYLAAGRSACYNDAVRLEHLHQAKVLFSEMDVPKRMAQVGEEIQKLVGAQRAVAAIHTPNPSREGNKKAKGAPPPAVGNVPTIITQNKRMQEILSLVDRIKNSDKTILITGETGTGKDLLAEYIHNSSDRAGKPYKVVNCANVPEHLWEAELFGARRGSYTGALTDTPGLIRSADGGTFCFDEIGEIPLHLQAKLLRVIETRRFRRVGGHSDTPVDVRFVALTNRDLREMMTEGTFRADLYHRLQRFPLHLPPLRDRREDFLPLLRHFLKGSRYETASETAVLELPDHLSTYPWPGNVREFRSVIERSLTLVAGDDWEGFRQAVLAQLKLVESDSLTKDRLLETLRRHGGNQSKAAEELGIPRTTLQSKMQRYGLK